MEVSQAFLNRGSMMNSSNSSTQQTTKSIERFIWDLTYACPLRCGHCYSESGRRPAFVLDRHDMLRILDVIVCAKPKRISLSGGEPLLVRWWPEAARHLCAANIPVTLFTSGWLMNEDIATELAISVSSVAVSIDGANEHAHDLVRARHGSFRKAMTALELLDQIKRDRVRRGKSCYKFGIDYTVTRSGRLGLERFVAEVTSRFPTLDFVRFGAVIPAGLAQETSFATRELLTNEDLDALSASESLLAANAMNGAHVSVTDVRYFLPGSSLSVASEGIAHIEPDGALRACPNFEAKVGNVLHEPLEVLWSRALAWRREPFVAAQMRSINNVTDWAAVTRVLDRRFGSESDRARIARRSVVP